MAQYIDKSDVMAEIEKRITSLEGIGSENYLHDNYPEQYAMLVTLKSLKFSIDTPEVKEVDLEKEFDNYAKDILACDVQFEPFTHLYNCAKHFFELGMQQSKNDSNNEE